MLVGPDGWLERADGDPQVFRRPTCRTYRLEVPKPVGIVWHWTAGKGGPKFADNVATGIMELKAGDVPASWHVLIARDGSLYQSAPLTLGTWHCGKPGDIAGRRYNNINRATIGCELENAGKLERVDDRWFCWPVWKNPAAPRAEREVEPRWEMPTDRVVELGSDGAYDSFTPEQVSGAAAMLTALVKAFGWSREVCVLGHYQFDSPRKIDPGPVWMQRHLPYVLDLAFGADSQACSLDPTAAPALGGTRG